ncbi:MAG: hypothetical protein HY330_00585 [Chloroflexi bacterium]|nr:hypothetical protein [Chloroflexota bacterium]
MSPLLTALALALAAAALAEFILLRVLLRLGPVLPSGDAITGALGWAYQAGLWSLNLAGVLAVALLGLLALGALRERRLGRVAVGGAAAGAAALLLAGWALSLAGGGGPGLPGLLAQAVGLPAALALAAIGSPWRGWRRGWLWLVYGAYLAASAHFLARLAGAAGGTGATLTIAEALAVAAALAAPLALRAGWQPRAALVAGLVAVLYAGFALAQPSIARFFVIWDFGFGGALGPALHSLALAGLVYAVAAALSTPALRLPALGLWVVALGGLRLDYTYFGLLAAAGFVLLAAGPRPPEEELAAPRPARAERLAQDAML